jgi:hypothetical protein
MLALAFSICLLLLARGGAPSAVQDADFVPVGVLYDTEANPQRRTGDLETIQRRRFNVVAEPADAVAGTRRLARIERLLGGDKASRITMPAFELGIVPIVASTASNSVRETAWTLLARGARGVVFEDWGRMLQNEPALAEASAFAEAITTNAALYAPLRRVESTGPRALVIDGDDGRNIEAQWLESADALVLIAVNHGADVKAVTLTFTADIPEAIWQNMLTGGAVNFVAGPLGPTYQRTFPPHDVLVLMIRKRWR